jgi:P2 family phage major capsid protein
MLTHQLTTQGRQLVSQFVQQIGEVLGVDATMQFTIEPGPLQTLNELIVLDGTPFLQAINVAGVPELKGQKLFMAQGGLIAKRTKIDASHERVPKDYSNLTNRDYELVSIESDVALGYALIDMWAKFPNFAALWNQTVRKAIANDRVRVGFWGVEATANASDPVEFPNGEDLAPGWLQQIREYNSGSQYLAGTTVSNASPPVTTHVVVLGDTTYPYLDYLVSLTKAKIDPVFINDPDLVVLISQDLVSYEEAAIFKAIGHTPQQKDIILANQPDGLANNRLFKNYGGLPSFSIPYMPDGVVLVTSLSNLSIYYQTTSWRRLIRDYAPKNQYQDFSSRNEGYVVEDFRKTSLVDGITLKS